MKTILKYMLAGSLLMGAASCDKLEDFGDTINRNPNTVSTPTTRALLTNVLVNLGVTSWNSTQTRNGSLYCQYLTETQYTDQSRYASALINWDGIYVGNLYDLQNIINYSTSNPADAGQHGSINNQIAIARILKAFHFAFLTDMYGDLPYRNALQGDGKLAYDKQADVYPLLITELKNASAQFDNGPTVAGDVMYNGSVAAWKRFANSVRMMLAMRWVKVDAAAAQTWFMEAYNDAAGHITTNAQNAKVTPPGGNYNNMFYTYYNITLRDDYGVAKPFMDFLSASADKRIGVYGSSTTGFPYGLTRDNAIAFANANPNFSRVFAAAYRQPTTPEYYLTASYITLIKAEAAQRGWIAGGNAQQLYQDAIKLSWDQWGISYTPAELTAYYANANVAYTAGNELTRIAQQYWVTNFPNGWLGFSDWRRTNVPVLTPAPGTPAIPVRLNYGPSERTLNPTNWAAAAALYNNDSQFAPVHWDR